MNIQDLGAIGELVSAIAVIASVLYLAVQIRHGLDGYRSAIAQQITTQFSNMQMEIAKDDKLLSAWSKAQADRPLDEQEALRAIYITSSFMIAFENMFYQYRAGMLDKDSYYPRRVAMTAIMRTSLSRSWWQRFGRHQFPPEFVTEVESVIKDHQERAE